MAERAEVCTGRDDCSATEHVHGCYADYGGCDSPHEHLLTIPKVGDRCVQCRKPVGLHDGVKAIDCLTKLAQGVPPLPEPPTKDRTGELCLRVLDPVLVAAGAPERCHEVLRATTHADSERDGAAWRCGAGHRWTRAMQRTEATS